MLHHYVFAYEKKSNSTHLKERLLIAAVTVGHVHSNQERWCGDKDELKTPEANVGDGKELIVTDVLTARLRGGKKKAKNHSLLLICGRLPLLARSKGQQQYRQTT